MEPPGLFRGRGKHPKMGMIKQRCMPERVAINVGPDTKVPPCPLPGEHVRGHGEGDRGETGSRLGGVGKTSLTWTCGG